MSINLHAYPSCLLTAVGQSILYARNMFQKSMARSVGNVELGLTEWHEVYVRFYRVCSILCIVKLAKPYKDEADHDSTPSTRSGTASTSKFRT